MGKPKTCTTARPNHECGPNPTTGDHAYPMRGTDTCHTVAAAPNTCTAARPNHECGQKPTTGAQHQDCMRVTLAKKLANQKTCISTQSQTLSGADTNQGATSITTQCVTPTPAIQWQQNQIHAPQLDRNHAPVQKLTKGGQYADPMHGTLAKKMASKKHHASQLNRKP